MVRVNNRNGHLRLCDAQVCGFRVTLKVGTGVAIGTAVLAAFLLSGCASDVEQTDTDPTSSVSSSPQAAPVFTGTPDEYTEAHRACMERAGFTIKPAPEGSGGAFEIDHSGHTDAEFSEAVEQCGEEIGSPDMTSLSDEQLRASYDMRVRIQECLVENGWSAEQPLAWETFRDQVRAGTPWEPMFQATVDASPSVASQAQRTCDLRDGQTW